MEILTIPVHWKYSLTVLRDGDYFLRRCKTCHQYGAVGIYPGRDEESLRFITRPNWRCRSCEQLDLEIEKSFLFRD